MVKIKKIIIALSIALVVTLAINLIISKSMESKYLSIPIIKMDLLKGDSIKAKDIQLVQVKKGTYQEQLFDGIVDISKINEVVLKEDVYTGEVLTYEKVITILVASLGRIELPTYRLGGDCSILLSYKDIITRHNYNIT